MSLGLERSKGHCLSALIITKSDLLGVKGTATTSNNTAEVERVLGIEAARWVFRFFYICVNVYYFMCLQAFNKFCY